MWISTKRTFSRFLQFKASLETYIRQLLVIAEMCHFQKVIYNFFFESRTDELTELCSGIVSFISRKRPKNADFLSIIELVLYSPRSPDSKSNCMSSHPYVRNSFITGQGNISQFRIDKKDQFYLNDLVKNAF